MNGARLAGKSSLGLFKSVKDSDGKAWFHTIPVPGEYPGMTVWLPGQEEPLKNQTIVVSPEDYQVILGAFQRDKANPDWHGLLVDKEHFSLEAGESSEAAAWAEDMRIDADGIWTRWSLTALGKELLSGDVYRMRSPVSDLVKVAGREGCWKMNRLTGIGLTNTPFFKNLSSEARARGEQQKGAVMLLEKLRERLKMDAAADEQAVYAKVCEALDKSDADSTALGTARARVTELETAQRGRDWDAFHAENKAQIADVETIRARFMADPEAVRGMFKALKPVGAPTAPARRIGQDAQTPSTETTAALAAKKPDREAVRKLAQSIAKDTGCRMSMAVCQAERRLRKESK